ncbi:MAG: arsenate reductase ArsC [Bacteroidales bacterium]|nr:arsenate reductase ArsC [Bacteroidales bacterium]MDZ4204226.1 arsenate reductase ArsC [Bacteroidales bacterium]
MKVLILCTGNSCRSQMAHGFLQSFDQNLKVYSAGTKASGQVNEKAVEVMKEIGIDISRHTSDPVTKYQGEEWDFVITVCDSVNKVCPAFQGNVKHRLHIGFDDPFNVIGSDTYILNEYRRIRDEIYNEIREFYFKVLPRKTEVGRPK